jgi:hypothetical protein
MKDELEHSRLLIDLVSDDWYLDQIQEIPQHLSEQLAELGVIVPKDDISDEGYFP